MESRRRNILALTPSAVFGSMWLYSLYSMSAYIGTLINACVDDAACISEQFGGMLGGFAAFMFIFGILGGLGVAIAPSIMFDLIPEDIEELPEEDYTDEE